MEGVPVWLFLGLCLWVWVCWKAWSGWSRLRSRVRVWSRIPECPEGNWLLGHVLPLARSSTPWHVLLDWLAESASPIVRFRILNRLAVIVDDPVVIKRMFQTHFKAYPKDVAFSYGTFLSILGTGLVTSDGAMWQGQRVLMAPALRVDLLETVIPIARRALKRLLVTLEEHKGTGRPLEIASEFRHLTLQVIGEAIMSLQPEACDRVLAKTYLPIMEECNRRVIHRWRMYVPTPEWFEQHRRLTKLNGFLLESLKRRWDAYRPTDGPSDLLDQMIAPLKAKGEGWNPKLITQMIYEIKTFLLAGHETSASMLAWALYELIKNPECLSKVLLHLNACYSLMSRSPGRQDIEQMTYTLAILKETLRKYSVVPVVCREVAIDGERLSGFSIPKDTMIVVSIKGVHQKYKDPEKFDPDRFLPGGEYDRFDEEIRPFMFLPFIQGPRNCLGQYFALLEARYVLGYLVHKFDFAFGDDRPIVPGDAIPETPSPGLNVLIT